MTGLRTTPLHDRFGVEITGAHLREIAAGRGFAEVRAAFEAHSLLLFRGQGLSAEAHLRLAALFGPVEDRQADERKPGEKVGFAELAPELSNVLPDGTVADALDLKTLNLKANQLWHTDSTFLPVPALSNILTARVVTTEGGETAFASTRAAWADMPAELCERVRGQSMWHRFSHSRARISAELAMLPKFTKWPDQLWPAIWRNPVNGAEALYIASHAFAVDGMPAAEGAAQIDELIAFCTQDEYVYTHKWQVGDALIWDERATLHRGLPWPYDQPRTLASICSSVTPADGLDEMRRPARELGLRG
jgi:alpha-ketoglutarate-dependent 2,4-dichlorophenoxyacetate dioxygenase